MDIYIYYIIIEHHQLIFFILANINRISYNMKRSFMYCCIKIKYNIYK